MNGSGGITGSGGTNKACGEIEAAYASEIPNAKMCSTIALTKQCQQAVSKSLGCNSNCITYVQDPTKLNQLAAQWVSTGCTTPMICPLLACLNPTSGTCTASSGLTAGMCQDVAGATTTQ